MASKFHRMIGRERPDTTADIAERVAYRAAGTQAHTETLARFGAITAANAAEAIAWQEARIKEILGR